MLMFGYQFFCQQNVTCGPAAVGIVQECRKAVARSLAQTYVAWNHGVEHHVSEVSFQFVVNLVGEAQACVELLDRAEKLKDEDYGVG